MNSGDAARAGAERFVTDLQAFNAVRESLGNRTPETLHVLAHSYGTTVTSNALAAAALNVASFTMLGSAGIEKEIRNTGDLHVPAGHVYASEASGDGLADLGPSNAKIRGWNPSVRKCSPQKKRRSTGPSTKALPNTTPWYTGQPVTATATWIKKPRPCMKLPSQQPATETVSCQTDGLFRLPLDLLAVEQHRKREPHAL
ncbi:pimeloyl-ACP methyl ester carboxylesterase [Paenarthrobacter nitroguajacolicus]|nr:pimeloyl-ACP methyl ester carboxylesterase [Paenarthrobacter nitroguajacolicus]